MSSVVIPEWKTTTGKYEDSKQPNSGSQYYSVTTVCVCVTPTYLSANKHHVPSTIKAPPAHSRHMVVCCTLWCNTMNIVKSHSLMLQMKWTICKCAAFYFAAFVLSSLFCLRDICGGKINKSGPCVGKWTWLMATRKKDTGVCVGFTTRGQMWLCYAGLPSRSCGQHVLYKQSWL